MAAQNTTARFVIDGEDRTAGAFRSAADRLRQFSRMMDRETEGQVRTQQRAQANQARSITQRVASGGAAMTRNVASTVAGVGIADQLRRAYVGAADFDRRMTRIGINANVTGAQVAGARVKVDELADALNMPRGEVVGGLETMVRATGDLEDSLKRLPAVAKTAFATGASTEDMAATAVALGKSFGVTGESAERAFDILAEGGKLGMFELKDMAAYLPTLLPIFASIGYKGEEGLAKLVAVLQEVRSNTGGAEQAFSATRDILAKFQTPESLKDLGKILGRSAEDIYREIQASPDKLSTFVDLARKAMELDSEAAQKIFGDAQAQAGLRALANGYKNVGENARAAQKARGVVDEDTKKLKDARSQLDALANSWERATHEMGRFMQEAGLATGLEWITEHLNRASNGLERFKRLLSGTREEKAAAIEEMRHSARLQTLDVELRGIEEQLATARANMDAVRKQGGINAPYETRIGEAEIKRLQRQREELIGPDESERAQRQREMRALPPPAGKTPDLGVEAVGPDEGDRARAAARINSNFEEFLRAQARKAERDTLEPVVPGPNDPGSASENTLQQIEQNTREQKSWWQRLFSRTAFDDGPGFGGATVQNANVGTDLFGGGGGGGGGGGSGGGLGGFGGGGRFNPGAGGGGGGGGRGGGAGGPSIRDTGGFGQYKEGNEFFDAIQKAEGTTVQAAYQQGDPHNTVLGHGKYGLPNKPITQMTLDEAFAFGRTIKAQHGTSSALGAYQIVGNTMRQHQAEAGLKGSDLFSAENQRKLAAVIAQREGLSAWEGFKRNPAERARAAAALGRGEHRKAAVTPDAVTRESTEPFNMGEGEGFDKPNKAGYYLPVKTGNVISVPGDAREGGRTHRGIDIGGKTGEPIVATSDQTVTASGVIGSKYGFGVKTVDKAGKEYVYAHMNQDPRLSHGIQVGQALRGNQPIGGVGQSGNARTTPPHLHYEERPRVGAYENSNDPRTSLFGSRIGRGERWAAKPATAKPPTPAVAAAPATPPTPPVPYGGRDEGTRARAAAQLQAQRRTKTAAAGPPMPPRRPAAKPEPPKPEPPKPEAEGEGIKDIGRGLGVDAQGRRYEKDLQGRWVLEADLYDPVKKREREEWQQKLDRYRDAGARIDKELQKREGVPEWQTQKRPDSDDATRDRLNRRMDDIRERGKKGTESDAGNEMMLESQRHVYPNTEVNLGADKIKEARQELAALRRDAEKPINQAVAKTSVDSASLKRAIGRRGVTREVRDARLRSYSDVGVA